MINNESQDNRTISAGLGISTSPFGLAGETDVASPLGVGPGISEEARTALRESVKPTPKITVQQVLDGEAVIKSPKGQPINQDFIDAAKNNNMRYFAQIEQAVSAHNRAIDQMEAPYQGVDRVARIPGTTITSTGERVPADLGVSTKEPILGLVGDSPAEEVQEYSLFRIGLNNSLKDKVFDPNVQELINDQFGTDFIRQFVRDTEDFAKDVSINLPINIVAGGSMVAAATTNATTRIQKSAELTMADFDTVFSEEFKKAYPTFIQDKNTLRQSLNSAGFRTSYAQKLNDQMIDAYIERFGLPAFLENYRKPLNDGTGRRLNLPLITEEAADAILDYTFSEQGLIAQFGQFAVPNLAVSGAFAKMHKASGVKKLERYNDLKKRGLIDESIPMRMALAQYDISKMAPGFAKSFRGFQKRFGDLLTNRFGYEGSIGTAAASAQFDRSLANVTRELDSLNFSLNSASRAGKTGNATVTVRNAQGVDETMTYADALTRRNFLQDRHENMVGRGIFSKYTPDDPFYKNVLVDDLVITAGQTVGYNFIPGFAGNQLSPEVGGVIGALGTAIFGRPLVKGTGATLRGIDSALLRNQATPLVKAFGMTLEKLPLIPRGALVNRNFEDISNALGTQLGPAEIEALTKVAGLLDNMSEEGVDAVYKNLAEYNRVRTDILKRFEGTDKYKEASEAFSLTFAYASGLAPLQAIEAQGIRKFSIKNLRPAVEAQLAAENSLRQAELGFQRLNELVAETTGVKMEDTTAFQTFVEGFQKAADGQMRALGERRRGYLELLDEYKTLVLRDPTSKEAANVLTALTDLEIRLTPGAAEDLEVQRTILTNNINMLGKSLQDAAENVDSLRGAGQHDIALGRLTEDMADHRDEKVRLLGRQIYGNAEKTLGDKKVDLADIVTEMTDRLAEMQGGDIRLFFGGDAGFFKGRTGRHAMQALNRAAERNLKDYFGDNYEVMIGSIEQPGLARARNYIDAEGNVVENLPIEEGGYFVGEDASLVEIAMALYKNQSDEGIFFQPFQTSAFEADELYRHLRDTGERIANSQGQAAAKPYRDIMKLIDDKIDEIPDARGVMQDARSEYKKIVFDPVAAQGSYGQRADSSRDVVELENPPTYRRAYERNTEPHTWNDPLAEAASRGIATGDATAFTDFRMEMESFNAYWADGVERVGDNSIFIYDMRLPKNSEDDFKTIQAIVRNAIQAKWADETGSNVLDLVGKDITDVKGGIAGGYNFNRVENVEKLQEHLRIKVITADNPDGEIVNWVDLADIVAAERDIVEAIGDDSTVRESFEAFRDTVNRRTGSMADANLENLSIEKRTADRLNRISETTDPVQFYEKYIANYDINMFRGLRDTFVAGYARENSVSEEEALKAFNDGVVYQTLKGIRQRASKGEKGEVPVMGFDGQKKIIKLTTNPVQLAGELRDKNVRAILSEVMDEDHIDFMQDLADMTIMASGVQFAKYSPTGIARGISPNEIISRAFNIARGMVSPTYVGAEFAFRVLQQMEVDSFQLAASNKEASRIMLLMMRDPKLVTDSDVRSLSTILIATANRELLRYDAVVPEYTHPDDIEAAMIDARADVIGKIEIRPENLETEVKQDLREVRRGFIASGILPAEQLGDT